jgi:hypothetical protein
VVLACGLATVTLGVATAGMVDPTRAGPLLPLVLAAFLASLAAATPARWRQREGSPWPVVELAGSNVAATLAWLRLLDLAGELPRDRGDPGQVLLAAGLAVAATAAAGGALWRASPVRRTPAGELAALGAATVVIAAAFGLVVGDRALGQLTAWSVATSVAAALAVLATERRRSAAAAVVLALLGALAFGALAGAFGRGNFGRADLVFFLLHAAGTATVVLAALRAMRRGPGR